MGSEEDLHRLESKVDKLTDAVMRLVLIEERQFTQGERIESVETQLSAHQGALLDLERRVDKWINRGIGARGLVIALFAVLELGAKVWSPH